MPMPVYSHKDPHFELISDGWAKDEVRILSFEGEQQISRLFEFRIELLSENAELDPADILNKRATLVLNRGDEDPVKINGIITLFQQSGRSPDYVSYHAILHPRMWRLSLNRRNAVYQEAGIEDVIKLVMRNAGFSGSDFEFDLKDSGKHPKIEYWVQYQESDFDFINRRLEHLGIYYFIDHRGDDDVIVFTDHTGNLPAIDQNDDIFYNPNRDPLSDVETIQELIYQEKVVTGLFQVKDYNPAFPDRSLLSESNIDTRAPGSRYEYASHYHTENDGAFLATVRNQEALSGSRIFKGVSDCRLFQAGHTFDMGKHYRDEWNDKYLLTAVRHRGNQRSLFGLLMGADKVVPTYQNQFIAVPEETDYRPPRVTPVPTLHGIMSAKVESRNEDEYAFIDDQGRYHLKMPFDLDDWNSGEASLPVRLSQPYSGPDYGIHFPNHAGTEMVWACINGDVDRPIGLGTIPNPSNASPSTSANKAQSVIRTAGRNELTLDDTTGNENIFLHGTKDWTIDIVNNKDQSIGNDETASVGNDRKRTVGNNENISIGSDREESIGGSETTTIVKQKSLIIGISHSITVGASSSLKVGGNHGESVGINHSVSAGSNTSKKAGKNMSAEAGKNLTVKAGEDYSLEVGKDGSIKIAKKTKIQSGDDLTISGGKKAVIDIKDQLTLKCGKASIILKKNGDIQISGKKINIKGTGDVKVKGSKAAIN